MSREKATKFILEKVEELLPGSPNTALIKNRLERLTNAEFDHLIPSSLVEMTARSYGVEAHIFPAMGHGVMLEKDWQKPAQQIRDWLKEQRL